MELPSRKTKRAIEPVDEWLQNEGYYRKHGPKDPTCLFRAISEQVYHNQRSHIKVRKECIQYMRENKQIFEEKISTPYNVYLDQMACITESGGMNEVLAMSLLYKRNVVIFHGQKLTKETVIDNNSRDSFLLCFTPPKQYETVYTQEYTANAGFCQSIVYQLLYKDVFKMNNIDLTVNKMLHERNTHLRHDKFFLKGNLEMRNELTLKLYHQLEDEESEESQLLSKGITPFPYRVAKALDPNIYRNVEYDIWHEIRREVRNSGYMKYNSTELQIGSKCLVQLEFKENDKINNNFPFAKENWNNNTKTIAKPKSIEPLLYTGHIQEMSKKQGPVVVFIEELGQKMTVSYETLKPFPQRKVKQNSWAITSNKRNIVNQNSKWKKPWNTVNRRTRDQMTNENSNADNKNQLSNCKTVTRNTTNTPDCSESQLVKQVENYTSQKEYTVNGNINLNTALENTHLTSVETIEQAIDKKVKTNTNNSTHEDQSKKQVTNFGHETNTPNKQNNSYVAKNDVFYPPYPNNSYHPVPRYPGDSEVPQYDMGKNLDIKGNEISCSDPATVRHFYNLGVKYYWTQNMWSNGINSQLYDDNSFFVFQPNPDVNINTNGTAANNENMGQNNNCSNNNSITRTANRPSPPRHRDQGNTNFNNPRPGGQKQSYRNPDHRNPAMHQASNTDINRNQIDSKNTNINEQSQQMHHNRDTQRGNKVNGVAPRFKRNYEAGKNRNDHHNNQHHYNRQQQHHQQDHEMRNNKKPLEAHMNDASQLQQSYQQPNGLQHQQQSQQPPLHPQPSMIQTPSPPLNNSYAYPVPYSQMPYMPMGSYPPESEAFPPGPYYPTPPGYVQVPYLPASELPEPPMYPAAVDSFPAQYPPVYSQYVYHPPAIYPNQPPPSDGCYSPAFPGQPYFIPYPPPPPAPLPPPSLAATTPNPQSAQ